jgi:hypothetical protein
MAMTKAADLGAVRALLRQLKVEREVQDTFERSFLRLEDRHPEYAAWTHYRFEITGDSEEHDDFEPVNLQLAQDDPHEKEILYWLFGLARGLIERRISNIVAALAALNVEAPPRESFILLEKDHQTDADNRPGEAGAAPQDPR